MLRKVSLLTFALVFCAGALFGQGARVVMETAYPFSLRSVPFSLGNGLFGEDSSFAYNAATHRLSLGSNTSPEATLHLSGSSYPQIVIDGEVGNAESGNVWLQFLPSDPHRYFDFSARTSDGADTKIMRMSGGGDVLTTRGAVLELDGNEAGGSATLSSGDSGGYVSLNPGISDIKWGKPLVPIGSGPTATLGATGGAGPTSSAQSAWMRAVDSTGQAIWIPVYK